MSKWVTLLQNNIVGQGSYSWTVHPAVCRASIRFASRQALRVSDEEVLGLLQEFQTTLEPTNVEKATNDNDSKQWRREGGTSLEDMPLSPLIHPNLINARKRYIDSKPLPSKERTEFQNLLEKNPFAQLLASPVRQCALTGIRFPKMFLVSFTLRTHPKTGAPWYDPMSLEPKEEESQNGQADKPNEKKASVDQESISESSQQQVEPPNSAPGHTSLQDNKINSTNKAPQLMQDEALPKWNVQHLFPTVEAALQYMPDRPIMQQHAIIQKHKLALNPSETNTPYTQSSYRPFSTGSYMISDMAAYYRLSKTSRRSLQHIIPRRWKEASASHPSFNLTKDVVWRADMDMFALDLMRRRVVHLLNVAATLQHGFVVRCHNYKKIGDHHQVACVLWLGTSLGTLPMDEMEEKESKRVEVELEGGGTGQDMSIKDGADKNELSKCTLKGGEARLAKPINSLSIPPPPYATILHDGHHIPLFNLNSLLGMKHIDSLRLTETSASAPLYVMKRKRHTLQAVLWLWRLMTYIGGGVERGLLAPEGSVKPEVGMRAEDEKSQNATAYYVSEASQLQDVSPPNPTVKKTYTVSSPNPGLKLIRIQEISSPNPVVRKIHVVSLPPPRAKKIKNSQAISSAKSSIPAVSPYDERKIRTDFRLKKSEESTSLSKDAIREFHSVPSPHLVFRKARVPFLLDSGAKVITPTRVFSLSEGNLKENESICVSDKSESFKRVQIPKIFSPTKICMQEVSILKKSEVDSATWFLESRVTALPEKSLSMILANSPPDSNNTKAIPLPKKCDIENETQSAESRYELAVQHESAIQSEALESTIGSVSMADKITTEAGAVREESEKETFVWWKDWISTVGTLSLQEKKDVLTRHPAVSILNRINIKAGVWPEEIEHQPDPLPENASDEIPVVSIPENEIAVKALARERNYEIAPPLKNKVYLYPKVKRIKIQGVSLPTENSIHALPFLRKIKTDKIRMPGCGGNVPISPQEDRLSKAQAAVSPSMENSIHSVSSPSRKNEAQVKSSAEVGNYDPVPPASGDDALNKIEEPSLSAESNKRPSDLSLSGAIMVPTTKQGVRIRKIQSNFDESYAHPDHAGL